MSLLLLLWPYGAPTPPQIIDYGVKPSSGYILTPKGMIEVGYTMSVLQATTTQYSSPSTQYSSSTQVYGGVDRKNATSPEIMTELTKALFQNTTTQYSSSSTQYSSSSQVYGGVDQHNAKAPEFLKIGN